jgi:hypothetical protein
MGHGIREFLSVPANNIMQVKNLARVTFFQLFLLSLWNNLVKHYWFNLQSPTGLIKGMAEGTTSLLSNTLYAVSDAASQFSKVARKVFLNLM